MTEDLLPFGKYRGKPVREVAVRDPQYLQWLMQQSWFGEKHPHLVQIVQVTNNFGAEPEETPEHNAMQVRFLDCQYRRRIAERTDVLSNLKKVWKQHRDDEPAIDDFAVTEPEFERYADVYYEALARENKCFRFVIMVECKPSVGDDYPAVLRQMQRNQQRVRQSGTFTGQWGRWVLLVQEYCGTTVQRDQFVAIFARSRISVLFENELST